MPEAESPDPDRGVGLIIDGSLQAFQPSGRGELGVDVSPLGITSCPPPTWRYGPRKSML